MIEVKEEIQIGNVILEKGDKIKIIESLNDFIIKGDYVFIKNIDNVEDAITWIKKIIPQAQIQKEDKSTIVIALYSVVSYFIRNIF